MWHGHSLLPVLWHPPLRKQAPARVPVPQRLVIPVSTCSAGAVLGMTLLSVEALIRRKVPLPAPLSFSNLRRSEQKRSAHRDRRYTLPPSAIPNSHLRYSREAW